MDSPEPTIANPRRFYWLKRLLISFTLFYATIVGLYLWWSRSTTARLDALVAAARANGEPILPQDFTPADVPDADNAAFFLRRAASSIVIPQEIGKEYGAIPGELPLTGREMNLIERVRPAQFTMIFTAGSFTISCMRYGSSAFGQQMPPGMFIFVYSV